MKNIKLIIHEKHQGICSPIDIFAEVILSNRALTTTLTQCIMSKDNSAQTLLHSEQETYHESSIL